MPLFERGPLQQDTGSLAPRSLQDGSNIVNGTASLTTTVFIRANSNKKKLYVTDVSIQIVSISGAIGQTYLRDVFDLNPRIEFDLNSYTAGQILNFNFATPVQFPVGIGYYKSTGTVTLRLNYSGWEE